MSNVFKRTVDYNNQIGRHALVSFLDYSKAFDKISYWKLFHKLLDDKVDTSIVRLLVYWYSNQQACVCWHDCLSDFLVLAMVLVREVFCHHGCLHAT